MKECVGRGDQIQGCLHAKRTRFRSSYRARRATTDVYGNIKKKQKQNTNVYGNIKKKQKQNAAYLQTISKQDY